MSNSQQELYKIYIQPHEGHFLSTLLRLRRKVDEKMKILQREEWFQNPDSVPEKGFRHIQEYPNGYCLDIRNRVLSKLEEITDIPYLNEFRENRGVIEKNGYEYTILIRRYGIMSGGYEIW